MTDLTIHFDLPLDTNLPATYQQKLGEALRQSIAAVAR